ncbi:MAG: acylneuraminate cytidylyltransferase family protein [Candidatus Omnitrophota bacterium]
MKILATIAARGGSKGVKNKNIRPLVGKPLIVYTIEQVKKWGRFDGFIVSTDSPEIADVAVRHGAETPFLRPPQLATDTAGKMDVLRHALRKAEEHYGMKFDALLDLDATAPIRTVEDIENAVSLFRNKRPDCVFSAVKARKNPYFNMVEEDSNGFAVLCKEAPRQKVSRRQDAPAVFDMNASIYVYDRDFLLDENNMTPYAKNALISEMSGLSAVDIDTETDLKFIEFLIKEGIVKL